jgi:hypothetical protein
MSVIIQSIIKTNPMGRWYIELIDPNEEDTEERVVCLDIYEYAQKIEVIAEEYGNDIEVAWESEENVTPMQINEVRQQIMAYDAEQSGHLTGESTQRNLWSRDTFFLLHEVHHPHRLASAALWT